jgi:hypothetical protein
MKLGIDLALAGTPPIFYLQSKVTSYFPLASEVQSGQKTRWEHGHLAMLITEAPHLFAQGLYKRDISLIAMAFDLAVPPLALLVMLLFGYAGITAAIFTLIGMGQAALQVTLLSIAFLAVAIAFAWWGWGKRIIAFTALLSVPVYVILKIPHYLKFLFKRQKTWNKTERD